MRLADPFVLLSMECPKDGGSGAFPAFGKGRSSGAILGCAAANGGLEGSSRCRSASDGRQSGFSWRENRPAACHEKNDPATAAASQGYPDKAVLNGTLDQLKAAPDFKYASSTPADWATQACRRPGHEEDHAIANFPAKVVKLKPPHDWVRTLGASIGVKRPIAAEPECEPRARTGKA